MLALSRRPLRTVGFKRKKCQVNSRTSEFPQIRDDLALDKRFAKAKIADIESIHALTLTQIVVSLLRMFRSYVDRITNA